MVTRNDWGRSSKEQLDPTLTTAWHKSSAPWTSHENFAGSFEPIFSKLWQPDYHLPYKLYDINLDVPRRK